MHKINFIPALVFATLNVLIASLGMPGHAWPNSCKITSSFCSFNRYVTACTCYVHEILKFKNPEIWLAKSIFAFNPKTRFFPDMWFWENHKGYYSAWFKRKKSTHQWTIYFAKSKKSYLRVFWCIISQNKFLSPKIRLRHFFTLKAP